MLVLAIGKRIGNMVEKKKEFTPGKGALMTLVLVAMLNCMGGAAVAPALPAISEAYPHASETLVSMVITIPSLAVAVSGLFVGMLADRIGKAKTLAGSLALFTVAGLSGTVLPSLELILAGRFVMGIGMAGIATASTALVAEYYDAHTRAKMFGWQSAANGMSVLALETSGGFLALLGWRVPFMVYLIGIPFIILTALFIREKSATRKQSGAYSANDDIAARIPRSVVAICLAVSFSGQILAFLVPSKMPYLVAGLGADSAFSGLVLGGFGLSNIAASLLFPFLYQRLKRSVLTVVGFSFLSIGCTILGFSSELWQIPVGVAFVGFGVGTVMPLFMNWLAAKSSRENSGKYMGAFTTACNLGQFACSLLAGAVLAIVGTHQAMFLAAAVFGLAFVIGAILLRKVIDRP